jgi:hypothetical protein
MNKKAEIISWGYGFVNGMSLILLIASIVYGDITFFTSSLALILGMIIVMKVKKDKDKMEK